MASTPLNALNMFIAVARRLSYAAAARDLGVSPSALSQSVRQLEQRLGVALLTRTSRSVALTDAGRRLLDHAGPALDQALESLKSVTAKPGEVTGQIRLTVPAAAAALVLPGLITRFAERHPQVDVYVEVQDLFVDAVAEGFDAGIRIVESIDRDMVAVRLSPPARLVVLGAPAYLERRGIPRTPRDLLQHDCICIRWQARGEPLAWELKRGARTWRIPVRGPVTTNDYRLMRLLAVRGAGLGYGYEPAVREDLESGRLRVVLEEYAPELSGLSLYYPSRAQVSPALRAFVEVAREVTSTRRSPDAPGREIPEAAHERGTRSTTAAVRRSQRGSRPPRTARARPGVTRD